MIIKSRVRGAGELAAGTQNEGVRPAMNSQGDLVVAAGLAPGVELARMQNCYRCFQTTAVNPVNAIPTTAAQVSLWNGEQDNGKSYVLHSVSTIVQASSFGGGFDFTAVGCLNIREVANPAGTLLTIRGTAGQRYNGKGVAALARTITNDGWFPIGNAPAGYTTAALDMSSAVHTWYLEGGLIIPPSFMFSISVLCVASGGLATVRSGFRWQEVQL
jgi:hypothetical protein